MSALVAPDGLRAKVSDLHVDEEFAALLPKPENYKQIKTGIVAHGVLLPILATKDKLVVDGHTRLTIAKELGLKDVPVIYLPATAKDVEGGLSTLRSMALSLNLQRRHLTEGQLATFGAALEAEERKRAAARKQEGQAKGRAARKTRGNDEVGSASADAEPLNSNDHDAPVKGKKATEAVAEAVGISARSYERAKAVMDRAPDLAAQLASGEKEIGSAYRELKRREVTSKAEAEAEALAAQPEVATEAGVFRELAKIPTGAYRCIYADPPWSYNDEGIDGSAANQYVTMPFEQLQDMGAEVQRVAHPEGSHLWMWTTWPMIREGQAQEVLRAWGYSWASEAVWHKVGRLATGRSLRVQTEVLILGVRGKPTLLTTDERGIIEAAIQGHSVKPSEARSLVERCSPGPRLELFARALPPGWHGFGNQVQRVESVAPADVPGKAPRQESGSTFWGVSPPGQSGAECLIGWGGSALGGADVVTLFRSKEEARRGVGPNHLFHKVAVEFEKKEPKK